MDDMTINYGKVTFLKVVYVMPMEITLMNSGGNIFVLAEFIE